MKKQLVLSLIGSIFSISAAHAAPSEIMTCSIGDALGGIVVRTDGNGKLEIALQSMEDGQPDTVYSTSITPKQITNLQSGTQSTFALEGKGANQFGGADSHSMLVVFNFDGGLALMAEGGSVFRPTCRAPGK